MGDIADSHPEDILLDDVACEECGEIDFHASWCLYYDDEEGDEI